MDTQQNRDAWNNFVNFWKYFFIAVIAILIILAFVAL